MPKSVKAVNPSNRHQLDGFIKAARELGCDEDEAAFEAAVRKVAKAKPKAPDEKRGG